MDFSYLLGKKRTNSEKRGKKNEKKKANNIIPVL
jgi:hypothetical protein